MHARRARGFTIVEIGITLAVLGILIALGLPSFTAWIDNARIRTTAHSVQGGVQLARAEAVRRNLSVVFVLGGASGPSEWTVSALTPGGPVPMQTRSGQEGAITVVVAIAPAGANTLTFNGLGRVVNPNGDGSAAITQVDLCSGAPTPDTRKLRIVVGAGGTLRMCDPAVAAGDSRACPLVVASEC
jgi:type IV fimbrial biogenesis protein FimT